MSDELISDGTYTVRGPGGQLTMHTALPGIAMLPPEDGDKQRWIVTAESGGYTVRSAGTGQYLGADGDPDELQMTIRGTSKPFVWTMSTGQDGDETTYVLTSAASSDRLVLSMSLLRIYPPLVAILPPRDYSIVEWAFDAA